MTSPGKGEINEERIIKKCKKEFREVHWWIYQALAFLRPYRGECCRKTYVKDENEINYYEPGKIFRFKNITSAYKSSLEAEEAEEAPSEININEEDDITIDPYDVNPRIALTLKTS